MSENERVRERERKGAQWQHTWNKGNNATKGFTVNHFLKRTYRRGILNIIHTFVFTTIVLAFSMSVHQMKTAKVSVHPKNK